ISFFNHVPLLKTPKMSMEEGNKIQAYSNHKILDTSVVIDGRIADILKTGFLEGKLIIPNFVLEELQKIADSGDSLKRNRGRRGLDVLKDIQENASNRVEISDIDFDDMTEVDAKLVKLAKQIGGVVITNDFNLNKVAVIHGVAVLNINDLANAVKPIVMSGEEMFVFLVKDGKENGQAVAYLDDGTMIVVEGGKRYVGDSVSIVVTSVLQTSAGRMIFARMK
ncbi:MAG: PIN/TRAM domain-containing protein, partial [Acidaminococcaceae bacterium]